MKYEHLIPVWKEKYESGDSFRKIGEEYGVNKLTVNRTLKGHVTQRPKSEWSSFGEKWLSLYEEGYSKSDIASKYGASKTVVGKVLKKMGVPTNGKRKFTHLTKQWIEEYQSGDDLTDISERYGVSRQTVLDYLNEEGIQARSYGESSRIHTLIEDYFDELDEERCFHLGLSFGVGTTFEMVNTWVTSISFGEQLLPVMKSFFYRLRDGELDEGSIYRGKDGIYRVRFHSKHLYETLRGYGLTSKKEKHVKEGVVPHKKAFLSGFLVGGSSYQRERNDLWISGNPLLLKSMRPYLHEVVNPSSIKYYEKEIGYYLAIFQNPEVDRLIALKKRYDFFTETRELLHTEGEE
jgi:hypothetical protein